MVKQEPKRIIFCQGDKKELEEITREEYEHIPVEQIQAVFPEYKPDDYLGACFTFIEAAVSRHAGRYLKREMYKRALKLGADAVVHYRQIDIRVSTYGGYSSAQGTPLRRKSK